MGTLLLILGTNFIMYVLLRMHLVRKFRTGYTIYLKDENGNRQTLQDTIAYLLEQRDVLDQRILYLAGEMEEQWITIEKIKMVTGADKYCND
jgi:hypothetical protein|tara:strand:- start:4325 stop:4600 length:276 start_codon:yes stop_codon:yes gene_type:complete